MGTQASKTTKQQTRQKFAPNVTPLVFNCDRAEDTENPYTDLLITSDSHWCFICLVLRGSGLSSVMRITLRTNGPNGNTKWRFYLSITFYFPVHFLRRFDDSSFNHALSMERTPNEYLKVFFRNTNSNNME